MQRVSDVNAMGYVAPAAAPEYVPNTFARDPAYGYNEGPQINPSVPLQPQLQQHNFNPNYNNPPAPTNYYDSYSNNKPNAYTPAPGYPNAPPAYGQPSIYAPNVPPNIAPSNAVIGGAPFAMLNEPMVQDMALQYGQKLADHGKQLVESQFEKYVPVTRLKYYFAVDNNYVVKKLMLLFFPFTHRVSVQFAWGIQLLSSQFCINFVCSLQDWSLKYDQDNPVQPRYDINAPDLYIPTMAYITFVVLAGLVMGKYSRSYFPHRKICFITDFGRFSHFPGMQNRFSPEQLGIISSSALAYSLFELIIYSITLYVANISTTLKTLDLLSFAGYKFAMIDVCILVSILFKRLGYYSMFLYSSITLTFFLVSHPM